MEIVFATNNQHKLTEVRAILGKEYTVLSLHDIHCTVEIDETSETFEGNAWLKADYIHKNFGLPCFSDDSGLEVEMLNNAPGVYSARYAGEQGSHTKNMDKLLTALQFHSNRKARFRTVVCYLNKASEINYFNGVIHGVITREKKGSGGFGYDPVFLPDGYNITFAEMTPEAKNKISHRAMAVNELSRFLRL